MKTCGSCKIEKEFSQFYKSAKDKYQSYCKVCSSIYNQERFKKNRERFAQSRNRNMDWYNDLKRNPCVDCGQKHEPFVMHWDHLEEFEKKFEVGRITSHSKENILKEIAKCELVCANCHAYRTNARRKKHTGFV